MHSSLLFAADTKCALPFAVPKGRSLLQNAAAPRFYHILTFVSPEYTYSHIEFPKFTLTSSALASTAYMQAICTAVNQKNIRTSANAQYNVYLLFSLLPGSVMQLLMALLSLIAHWFET